VTGFWLAERAGVRPDAGYAAEWRTAVAFASYAGLVACTAVLFTVYEQIRAEAQARAEAAAAELARMAYHDALTGLANRARFLACTAAALARARAAGDPSRVAVLALDLDGFKAVNDTLGHEAGDAVLVEVAGRLLGATRGSDTVARLGGDEFAVLLDGVGDDADAGVVAARVVEAIGRPFVIAGAPARVGTSVGVARGDHAAGGDAAPDEGVATLLRHADYAMYQAKSLGKGRWAWFDPAATPAMAPTPAAAPRAPVRPRAAGVAAGGSAPARGPVGLTEPCRRRA
jgi:diguanylate cyclase (GGDEF)-like protein